VLASVLLCWVLSVGDGDSLKARCPQAQDARTLRLRVAEIDAPELRQAFGRQSRQALVALCRRQRAQVEIRARDAYGRSVARVRCQGVDVAQAQVRTGLAWVAPGYARGDGDLQALERQARQRRTGLWAQQRPTPPWVYRHRHAR